MRNERSLIRASRGRKSVTVVKALFDREKVFVHGIALSLIALVVLGVLAAAGHV